MIAPWIFELLRRERDWRAALPKIAAHLSELPDDRVRAGLDLGAAFEHIEPDRYHAIIAYQLAGAQRDGGRSRQLALEIGWWQAVGRLATVDLQSSGQAESLIVACRSLIDDGKLDAAKRLLTEHPGAGKHATAAGLRAELDGRSSEWRTFATNAKRMRGSAAADAYVTAARLARTAGTTDWGRHLEAALEADPQHLVAGAMMMDLAVASEDDKLVFDLMRIRCLGLDGYEYSEAVRLISVRLLLADPAYHAGMGRRLAKFAIERAYGAGLSEIPGHIALWTLLDAAAAQDGTRSDLLPMIMKGLACPIPDFDRTWLAALGAAICVEAGSTETAHTYAAIVATHAPSHPIVRELLSDASIEEDLTDDLELLEEDAQAPSFDDILPNDFDLSLAPLSMAATYSEAPAVEEPSVDPRFLDVSVRALDEHHEIPATRRTRLHGPVPVLDDVPDEPVSQRPRASAARPKANAQAAAAPAPTPAPEPAQTPVTATAAPASIVTALATSLDDAWDVDAELFPQRRQTSKLEALPKPPSEPEPAAKAAPEPAAVPAAPTPPRPKAPSVPPRPSTPSIPPVLVPAAAARVLKEAGVPRPLPKLPLPPNLKPRAERVAVAVDVVLVHGGNTTHAHTRDLSGSGFFAVTPVPFEKGTVVECEIRMPVAGELSAKIFKARAKAVRKDVNGVAFALVEPPADLSAAIRAYAGV